MADSFCQLQGKEVLEGSFCREAKIRRLNFLIVLYLHGSSPPIRSLERISSDNYRLVLSRAVQV
jgi:hypothetical protein